MAFTHWSKLYIPVSLIREERPNSYLIRMPSESYLSGYDFFHPVKLTRRIENFMGELRTIEIAYPDAEWEFKLYKYNAKRTKTVDIIRISSYTFLEEFENKTDLNYYAMKSKQEKIDRLREARNNHHTPQVLSPEANVRIKDDLIDD
ncbi:hypothetical protein HB904_03755 [Listeria booriae]|uniref:Uncharacterized protein n=1 Tax=Listeria booriae TaxID=1552123 RepID=A0A842A8U0_9LIST|nr:hypothetical protein [Listeria booriae]MBC1615286.1 hypothetical protein [Listeria booriae]